MVPNWFNIIMVNQHHFQISKKNQSSELFEKDFTPTGEHFWHVIPPCYGTVIFFVKKGGRRHSAASPLYVIGMLYLFCIVLYVSS